MRGNVYLKPNLSTLNYIYTEVKDNTMLIGL